MTPTSLPIVVSRHAFTAVITGAWLLTGCSTLPSFDASNPAQMVAPRVSDLVRHIECEIVNAVKAHPAGTSEYVANIDLTLEVTTNQGFNPSLSFIHPYATAGDSFTAALSAQYAKQQHRTMTLSLSMLVNREAAQVSGCEGEKSAGTTGGDIQGLLGIDEIFASGMTFADKATSPINLPVLGVSESKAGLEVPDSTSSIPTFGSTVDFTLIYGAGGGPNWTLTHFSGVSPSSGLVSLLRTNKDTLQIAFAKVTKTAATSTGTPAPAPAAAASAVGAAARAAQDQVTRQVLRTLLR